MEHEMETGFAQGYMSGFPKIMGTLFGGSCNNDPSILGSILGSS